MSFVNIFWFRRDLRLEDNHGLFRALNAGLPVLPVFIYDTGILDRLPSARDARLTFIKQNIDRLKAGFESAGSSIYLFHGSPEDGFRKLMSEFRVSKVYANHDYEPYAAERDMGIKKILADKGVGFSTFKDQVIFEKEEIVKPDGGPYTVFTPFKKRWTAALTEKGISSYPSEKHEGKLLNTDPLPDISLSSMGFEENKIDFPSPVIDRELISKYHLTRDVPALHGTSRLGIHLRFGTISIRRLVAEAMKLNETFLNELIWREFYMMILWNFPHVVKASFKAKYDRLQWLNKQEDIRAWTEGRTGYPMVDAGMRQLNATGYMHNRLRMITASFLVKHLLVDWRIGEQYFADRLLDFELSSNNGGWQWAAGTGCDAAPWFRVFNPHLQQKKFDPENRYIDEWVPEFGTGDYPAPVVDHKMARERALTTYKRI